VLIVVNVFVLVVEIGSKSLFFSFFMVAIIFLQAGFGIQILLIERKASSTWHCCLLGQVFLHRERRYGRVKQVSRVAHWPMKESHIIFGSICWSLWNHANWTCALLQALIFREHTLVVFRALIALIILFP